MSKRKRYYLLSKHEATFDKGMCMWWRPKAAGYTVFLETAGLYSEDEARRHSGDDTIAVPESVALLLSRRVVYVDDKQKLLASAVFP